MSKQHRGRTGALAGVAAAMLAAGCGSTVSLHNTASGRAPVGAPTATAGSSGLPPDSPAAPHDAFPAGAAVDGSGAQGGAAASPLGRTVTPQAPLRLGFVIPTGNTYNDPVTGTRSVTEDFTRIIPALVDDLNAHGGIAGRHVEASYATVPTEVSNSNQTADEDTACRSLTEDHHVFAVVAVAAIRFSAKCYAGHHTPVLMRTFLGSLDGQALRGLAPWVIGDDSPDLDTIARLTVVTMLREHSMTSPIGIAAPDDDRDRRVVQHVLLPALKAAGGSVAAPDVIYATDDAENGPSASAAAVLRWKADNVGTVIPFDLGPAWGVLGTAAQSQDFTPRWVLDSSGRPQWVLNGQAYVKPPPTERNAIALGVEPGYDVLDSDYPLRPAERHCLDIVNRALGTSLSHRTYGQGAGPLVACRSLALLRQALAPFAGRPLVARDIAGDVAALGERYVPLDVPRSSFAPGKPDGLAVYRTSHYVAACTCMRYDSPWMPVPA